MKRDHFRDSWIDLCGSEAILGNDSTENTLEKFYIKFLEN
jgi:hypothetical protein